MLLLVAGMPGGDDDEAPAVLDAGGGGTGVAGTEVEGDVLMAEDMVIVWGRRARRRFHSYFDMEKKRRSLQAVPAKYSSLTR
jgi:hypothetical protein